MIMCIFLLILLIYYVNQPVLVVGFYCICLALGLSYHFMIGLILIIFIIIWYMLDYNSDLEIGWDRK